MEEPARTLKALRIDRENEPPKWCTRRFVAVVAWVAIAVAALVAFRIARDRPDEAFASTPTPPVVAHPGVAGDVSPGTAGLAASGYLTARRRARVSAAVVATVVSLPVAVGERVAEGALLAQLDDTVPRARLEQARAEEEVARRTLEEITIRREEAARHHEWRRALDAHGITSREESRRARADHASLSARVAGAQASLDAAARAVSAWRAELARYAIRAPFGGVVIARPAALGETIGPDFRDGRSPSKGLLTLVDPASIEVEVEIHEAQLVEVEIGRPAWVDLDAIPGERFGARVHEIVPAADRRRASVRVWLRFEHADPRLWPGFRAHVEFRSGVAP